MVIKMSKKIQDQAKKLHDIMQPLNIINLSCSNIRARISNHPGDHSEYIFQKMDRIEEQIVRATQLLQELKASYDKDILPKDV